MVISNNDGEKSKVMRTNLSGLGATLLVAGCATIILGCPFTADTIAGTGGSTTTSTTGNGGSMGEVGGSGGHGGSMDTCVPGSTRDCKTTIAECAAGTQMCVNEGKEFGACTPVIQPIFDDCTTAQDEDCDGLAIKTCTGTPSFTTTQNADTAFDDLAYAVAFNSQKTQFAVAGMMGGTYDPMNGVTSGSVWAAKFDLDGNKIWETSFTPTNLGKFGVARGAGIDSLGNVVIAGYFTGNISDKNGITILTNNGAIDAFVAKLSSVDGSYIWAHNYGGNSDQLAYALSIDDKDNIFVTGAFENDIDLNGSLKSVGQKDIFVAKIDAAGNTIKGMKFGDDKNQTGFGIAADPSGDIFVAGSFDGSVNFGSDMSTKIATSGQFDAFLVKLSGTDFTRKWDLAIGGGGTSNQTARAVAVDATGNVAITGSFQGTITLNAVSILGDPAARDIFVARFKPDGTPIWSKGFVAANEQNATAVAMDGAGHVIVTGNLKGSIDFGGGVPVTSMSTMSTGDVFVAKLAALDGSELWATSYGDMTDQLAFGIATGSFGQSMIVGGFQGVITLPLPTKPITSAGGYDVFGIMLAP